MSVHCLHLIQLCLSYLEVCPSQESVVVYYLDECSLSSFNSVMSLIFRGHHLELCPSQESVVVYYIDECSLYSFNSVTSLIFRAVS